MLPSGGEPEPHASCALPVDVDRRGDVTKPRRDGASPGRAPVGRDGAPRDYDGRGRGSD